MTTTTTIDVSRPLGDLVAERPARARVLEQLGIDYCCHGRRPLDDTCDAEGLDVDEVAVALAAVEDTTDADIDGLGPLELSDHIIATHHAYLHEELPLLVALADKVRDVHGTRHPELVEVARLVHAINDDLVPHLAKEEQVLFPAISIAAGGEREFPFGTIGNPIRVLRFEHEQVGELLGLLHDTTGGYGVPSDGCASYTSLYQRLAELEADTLRHVHLENNVLFPAVEALAG